MIGNYQQVGLGVARCGGCFAGWSHHHVTVSCLSRLRVCFNQPQTTCPNTLDLASADGSTLRLTRSRCGGPLLIIQLSQFMKYQSNHCSATRCHCESCKLSSGSAFGTLVMFKAEVRPNCTEREMLSLLARPLKLLKAMIASSILPTKQPSPAKPFCALSVPSAAPGCITAGMGILMSTSRTQQSKSAKSYRSPLWTSSTRIN